jgi:O-antigen/teichoic acid export membrane protein
MFRDFLRAGFGGVASQFINFAALPIISRLYTPAAYAEWAIVITTATIVGLVACFRFELAIVIPKDKVEASSIFWGCIFIALGTGLIVALGLAVLPFRDVLGSAVPDSRLHAYIGAISLFAVSLATYTALSYWNIRHQRYMLNSFTAILVAVFTFAGQVGWAMMFPRTALGLVIGTLLGQFAGAASLFLGVAYKRNLPSLNREILGQIGPCLKRQRKFLQYSTPYTLFGILRERAALFVLQYFSTPTQVGLYAFAYRIMNFPVVLVSNSLRPVVFQAGAVRGVKGIESQINAIFKWLVILSTPFVVIYFSLADKLFLWFFGPNWVEAGQMGKFIIFPIFTFMFVNWMDRIMDLLGQQRLTLVLEVTFSIASITALCVGFLSGLGLKGSLTLQATVLVLYNITYLSMAYVRAGYDRVRLVYLFGLGVAIAGISFAVITVVRIVLVHTAHVELFLLK